MRFTRIILLLGSLVIFVPGRSESFTNLLTGTDLLPTSVLIASTNDPAIDWRGVTFGTISNQLANGWKQDATNASSGSVAGPSKNTFISQVQYFGSTTTPHYANLSGYSVDSTASMVGGMFFPTDVVLTNWHVLDFSAALGGGTNMWFVIMTNTPASGTVPSSFAVSINSSSRSANSSGASLLVPANVFIHIKLTNTYGNIGTHYIGSHMTVLPQ